ncbi:MAG: hypothetical protein PHQ58_11730 [Rhodoferax sp.]|uniref:hypothetical protein n=1 Tax=Rhodoferax sp. TaxID=50421 RepID=UPI00260C073A|nr:hypothetical protein [Rhodoferax sp.]MDD2881098.1 hypothetical protein [Rhodoferax sp.]
MKTLKEIKQLYPYQFKGKNLGFSIANGWLPEFSELCKKIDSLLGENKRGFHWIQLKEKFGSARYYWSIKGKQDSVRVDLISTKKVVSYETSPPSSKGQPQALFDQISELIDAAEGKTRGHCIVCGAPGKIDQHEGYVLMLCDMHAKLQAGGGDLDIWPKAEDE